MVLLLLVVLAAAPVIAVPVPAEKAIVDYYPDRIIGGIPATIDEFPFLVSLTLFFLDNITSATRVTTCGGTIITENWVLTASHCLKNNHNSSLQNINVRGGSSYLHKGGVIRHAKEIVSRNPNEHDIALIEVDEPWPLNEVTISLARLPRQDDPVLVGSTATIMGWGHTDHHGTRPEMLMKQDVVVISHMLCWFSYIWLVFYVTDKQMCTMFDPRKSPAGTYKGDSGGPVLVNGQVVGIVSWSTDYSLIPDVRTRVSFYIDWIERHVGPLPRPKS